MGLTRWGSGDVVNVPDSDAVADENLEASDTEPFDESTEIGLEIWAEFLKTGRVREGYVACAMWPEKARRIRKE